MIKRVPRELGRPCRLHRDCRLEPRLTNSRLIHRSVPSWWGRTGDERWYRQSRVAEGQSYLPPPPSSNRTDGFPVSGFTDLSRSKAFTGSCPKTITKAAGRGVAAWHMLSYPPQIGRGVDSDVAGD